MFLSLVIAILIVTLSCFTTLISSNRVIELNEKILEIYPKDKRSFMIKFYAPWCHHCRHLEPEWSQVAQYIHSQDVGIIVGRVDCTRHTGVATHFSVRGFPTIMFINGDKRAEFRGDRNKRDLIDFAFRMNGPSIKPLQHCSDLNSLRDKHNVFFVHFGEMNTNFTQHAETNHIFDWYYHSIPVCHDFSPGTYVIKKNEHVKYNESQSLDSWIKRQRFPTFGKITLGNFNLYMQTRKYLVIALLEEFKQLEKLLTAKNEEFRELMKAVAEAYVDEDKYLFGWTSELSTINSIAIQTISPLPNVVIINSSTLQYYLLDGEVSPQNIINLLEDLKNDSNNVEALGGDGYLNRVHRLAYDLITSFISMYQGNPLLTILIFGLPLSFFAIIIYTSCFSDLLDAKEEDDDEEKEQLESDTHEKKD